jgi:hypothetical protein
LKLSRQEKWITYQKWSTLFWEKHNILSTKDFGEAWRKRNLNVKSTTSKFTLLNYKEEKKKLTLKRRIGKINNKKPIKIL